MSKSIRISKRRGYTVIPNGLLPEGKITARAWGIYAYLLSRPDGWVIHVRQLQQVFKEGRDAIYSAMKQLREAGLLDMESYREDGQPPKKRYVLVDIETILGDLPDPENQDTGNQDKASPDTDSQDTALPDTGNQNLKTRALTTTDISTPENSHLPASLRSGEDKELTQKNRLEEVPLSRDENYFSPLDSGEDENVETPDLPASRQKTPPPPDVQELIEQLKRAS